MACASCAQRRAIMNKVLTKQVPLSAGVRLIGQTVKTDAVKIRNALSRIKFK